MSMQDFVVPPLSWPAIGRVADQVRSQFGLEFIKTFPVVDFLEKVLDQRFDLVRFEVGEPSEMDGAEGLADPNGEFIRIHERVYEAAVRGEGRARFTIAHEIGHYFLHTRIPMARARLGETPPPFRRAEPQANQFAAELLMPRRLMQLERDLNLVAVEYGVSDEAASNRISYLRKEGILN